MRTCEALALGSISSWNCSRWLPLPRERPSLEPPRRRAPAPAPALAPDPRRFVFYMIASLPARPDGCSGRSP
eukprot:6183178-Pleurochrysis_carterae.AAC.2